LETELEEKKADRVRYVGKDTYRADAYPKVTGELEYVDDIRLDGMLYGKILRSQIPHGNVQSVDVSDAERLRGVAAIITPFNVPTNLFTRQFTYVPWKEIKDRRLIDSRVRYVGDPVAAVVAEDPWIAEEAIERIRVEYEELPSVMTAEESIRDDAPLIHDLIEVGGQVKKMTNNVAYGDTFEDGNREQAYSESSKVFEGTFRTQPMFNAPLERRSIISSPTRDGGLEVWCTTQAIHGTRYCLAQALQLPLSKVNVHNSLIGGGFGLKSNFAMHEPIAAHLSLLVKKPVKITMDRDEDFTNGGRRPVRMNLKVGVSREGIIRAMEMDALLQSGAYDDLVVGATSSLGGWFLSMYRASYKRYKGTSVYTNNPVYSAMRGFLNPQSNFAVESFMDEIAESMGLDPLRFRLLNIPREGDLFYGQGPSVVTRIRSTGLKFILEEGARRIDWLALCAPVKDGMKVRSVGFAYANHSSGTAGELLRNPERVDATGAIVKVNEDGSVNLVIAMVDHGGGTHEVYRKICADTIGVRLDDVHLILGSTDYAPFDSGTYACRGSFAGGTGFLVAAESAKEQLMEVASEMLETPRSNLTARDGVINDAAKPERRVKIADVVTYAKVRKGGLIIAISSLRPKAAPPSYVACFVEVEVNLETGMVKVQKAVMGADVGTVISPAACVGQLHGGVAFGIGMALNEQVKYFKGRIANANFTDYLVARATDLPPIDVFFADTYEPTGPFGLKSIGESSTNPVASAIANAVSRAIGKRVRQLPMTLEYVRELAGSG
jgi:CO/xanthine dehydrogenase Mo-binding subunit